VTESSAALSIKVRIGEIDNPFRLAALAKFHRLITAALEIVPVRREHFRTAARLADHYSAGLRPETHCIWPWRPIEAQR
jgi:hypothetical protein